ncbi:MAG: hypothetical protein H0X25_05635 [Acidobacteriales bacterium]|nr:hypothetical protein [Terriglobales bacterium]
MNSSIPEKLTYFDEADVLFQSCLKILAVETEKADHLSMALYTLCSGLQQTMHGIRDDLAEIKTALPRPE